MGILSDKYPDSSAVERALNSGTEALAASQDNTAEIESVKNEMENGFGDRYTKSETVELISKTVAEKLAAIIAGAPESFDSLKEISDWILSHAESAAAMNSAIIDLSEELENKADKSMLSWSLIPETYTTMTSYAETLPNGDHRLFYRNASDKHILDAPVDANMFIFVYKYSATTIVIKTVPINRSKGLQYTRSLSGGSWGDWFEYTGNPLTANA